MMEEVRVTRSAEPMLGRPVLHLVESHPNGDNLIGLLSEAGRDLARQGHRAFACRLIEKCIEHPDYQFARTILEVNCLVIWPKPRSARGSYWL